MSKKLLILFFIVSILPSQAQQLVGPTEKGPDLTQLSSLSQTTAQSIIPNLVRFNGSLRGLQGRITVTFALYTEETGGSPIWSESQNVTLDSQGRLAVFLGGATAQGLPPDIFASGEARWLAMTPEDGVERPRIIFTSVPYALAAADAKTISGRTIDQFVTQEQFNSYLRRPSPIGPLPISPAWPIRFIWPLQAQRFEATSATGPSFISDAMAGAPFLIRSNELVQNLNVDLLHGFTDSDFAKVGLGNQFVPSQQFLGGIVLPPTPIPVQNCCHSVSSPLDFQAVGYSSAGSTNQTFRWQSIGSGQSVPQPQLSLYFSLGDQSPQPTGFSFNSDGSFNFAATQTFPGPAIMTAITPLLPAGGSQGSGVSETPTSNQPITQPPGTSLNVNTLNNIRTVAASDNWLVSAIGTVLTAGIPATVTLTPCPRGVDTSGNSIFGGPLGGYPVRIIDGQLPANSESVYVTGGNCKSAAPSGTIILTPHFSHTNGAYSIGSASAGIQEAINDACGTNPTYWENGACNVVIPPQGGPVGSSGYDIYDTIYFHANGSVLSGVGAILNCHERGPCLQVGNLTNSNAFTTNTIQGISFRSVDNRSSDPAFEGSLIQSTQRIGGTITIQTAAPHNLRTGDRVTQMFTDSANYWGDVPYITVTDATHYTYPRSGTGDIPLQVTPGVVALSYVAVLDNAFSTKFENLQYDKTAEYGNFNHFFDLWDDQNAQIDNFDNNAISLNHNLNWTGSFLWSGGQRNVPNPSQQFASVISVTNSTITANYSNCVTVYNSNQLSVQNTVCQAQGPWEFLVSNITGNYQGASFQTIYSEPSPRGNSASPPKSPWPGLGDAGFIGGPVSGAATFTISGLGGFGGFIPTVGSGSTSYVYYIVGRDLTTGAQTSPLPFMAEGEDSPSLVPVQWPRLASGTDVIVYDLIRNPAPEGYGASGGGYVNPYSGGCNGGSAESCGSVVTGLPQCTGFVCSFTDNTANATSAYFFRTSGFLPNPTFWPGTAVLSSTAVHSDSEFDVTGIAFGGAPTLYANICSGLGNNFSGGYTVCLGSRTTTANSGVSNQAPTIFTDGGQNYTGGTPGAKGRIIVEGTQNSQYHQIITLYDSNPGKTEATTGHRPVGDPGDIYLGIDPNRYMSIGGGQYGIATYINSIGNGNWIDLLTPSLRTSKVPIQAPTINVTSGIQINGSYGNPGQCVMSTGTGVTWGNPGGSSSTAKPTSAVLSGSDVDRAENPKRTPLSVSSVSTWPSPFSKTVLLPTVSDQPAQSSASWTSAEKTSGFVSFLSAIANGSCKDGTFPLSGVTASAALTVGWPADLSPGLLGSFFVSSPTSVTVRLCNFSGSAVTPGKLTFTAASVPYRLSGFAEIAFLGLRNGACVARDFSLQGVNAGEALIPRWPSTLRPGVIGGMRASGDNVIEVQLCNFSGEAMNLTSQKFGAFIAK